MKAILKLAHWQVFVLSWGPLSFVLILLFNSPNIFLYYLPLWLVLVLVGLMNSFIWVWAIAYELQKLSHQIHLKLFKVAFWVPFTCIWSFIAVMLFDFFIYKTKSFNIEVEMMLWKGAAIISVGCIIYGLIFLGRLIRSVELGRKPLIKNHLVESALMLFPPIGVWLVQPKLNRIYQSSTLSNGATV